MAGCHDTPSCGTHVACLRIINEPNPLKWNLNTTWHIRGDSFHVETIAVGQDLQVLCRDENVWTEQNQESTNEGWKAGRGNEVLIVVPTRTDDHELIFGIGPDGGNGHAMGVFARRVERTATTNFCSARRQFRSRCPPASGAPRYLLYPSHA